MNVQEIRDIFIADIENLLGYEVKSIEWIYGLGENVGDEEELYYFDVTLQVKLYSDQQGYISLSADSYCEDREDCIGTIVGMLEECNSNFGDVPSRTDINDVVSVMREYLYEFGDTKEKPIQDLVYFESN